MFPEVFLKSFTTDASRFFYVQLLFFILIISESYIPKVPRFEIPKHQSEEEPPKIENDFSPEAITITKQVGNIKDTELPGAFGADDALRELLDDTGSGEESGVEELHTRSARHRKIKPKHSVVAEHHDTHAENAANFGSHLPGTPGERPLNIYLLKVSNRDTRKGCKIWSKLTIKTLEQRQ